MNTPPNILVIMSDQHAPGVLGSAGHPCVQTPHLDALAKTGVRFTRAFCAYPMCTPSRASFMTGLLTPEHGVWELGSPLGSQHATWAHALRKAGFLTSIAGRMHFVGHDVLHGYERRAHPEIRPLRPFAYDPWLSPITDDHVMLDAVRSAGPTDQPTANERYDHNVQQAALAELAHLLEHRKNTNQPWSLTMGFIQPHAPYAISKRWWDRYEGMEIPLPASPPAGRTYEQCIPPLFRGSRQWLGMSDDGLTPTQIQNARRAYYAMITQIDDYVGQLIAQLKTTGEWDNTLVIYTSDHGDNHGEHGLWSKLNFFDASVGLPLIVGGGDAALAQLNIMPNQTCDALVSLIDWLPTMTDLTGQTWPRPLPGRSLLPLLRNPRERWPGRSILSDYACGGTRVPIRMVKRDAFTACFAPPFPPVLYNHDHDPHQWHDLGQDPAYQNILTELEAIARADGWDPAKLLPQLQQEKRVLHYLSQVEPS